MNVPREVAEYVAKAPEGIREMLERVREIALAETPQGSERISYQMPAVSSEGRIVVWYGAFREHVSLFPASDRVKRELGADLEPYLAGKGTIRFRRGQPLPEDLIRRVVRVRLEENRAAREGGA